jgi:hypothetical protein
MAPRISMTTDARSAHDITCPKYVRGEGKRCLHYRADGSCELPDELMCVEWLKRNPGQARAPVGSTATSSPTVATTRMSSLVAHSTPASASPAQPSLTRTGVAGPAESTRAPHTSSPSSPGPVSAQPKDLFGAPVTDKPAARSARAGEGAKAPKAGSTAPLAAGGLGGPAAAIRDPFRGLTTEDIERFKALGTEVRFEAEGLGEWWLVPEHTGKPRKEITPEHAATIARVLNVFPGARVVSFERVDS